jgi:hypothetical protein
VYYRYARSTQSSHQEQTKPEYIPKPHHIHPTATRHPSMPLSTNKPQERRQRIPSIPYAIFNEQNPSSQTTSP